jgi:hypothetical protein
MTIVIPARLKGEPGIHSSQHSCGTMDSGSGPSDHPGMTETPLREKSNFQNAINTESTVQPSREKYFA